MASGLAATSTVLMPAIAKSVLMPAIPPRTPPSRIRCRG
jgi:hypothetical protein